MYCGLGFRVFHVLRFRGLGFRGFSYIAVRGLGFFPYCSLGFRVFFLFCGSLHEGKVWSQEVLEQVGVVPQGAKLTKAPLLLFVFRALGCRGLGFRV